MEEIKAIQTYYKGYHFRSRLEARWAVFFDACGVEWEYEPEGYDLGDGLMYLPDFHLFGVYGRGCPDFWIEVKGKMTELDAEKITRFARSNRVYVVGNIPEGQNFNEIIENMEEASAQCGIEFYNYELIDGDCFGAFPCITARGFELLGDDESYLCKADKRTTLVAFNAARQARFEYGENGFSTDNDIAIHDQKNKKEKRDWVLHLF